MAFGSCKRDTKISSYSDVRMAKFSQTSGSLRASSMIRGSCRRTTCWQNECERGVFTRLGPRLWQALLAFKELAVGID
jgi:hypothetical protein